MFLQTLKKCFQLVLYLKESHRDSLQLVELLETCDLKEGVKPGTKVQRKFFDFVLTKQNCYIESEIKFACRNKELLMEGRSTKQLIFISNNCNDFCLNSQNSIFV